MSSRMNRWTGVEITGGVTGWATAQRDFYYYNGSQREYATNYRQRVMNISYGMQLWRTLELGDFWRIRYGAQILYGEQYFNLSFHNGNTGQAFDIEGHESCLMAGLSLMAGCQLLPNLGIYVGPEFSTHQNPNRIRLFGSENYIGPRMVVQYNVTEELFVTLESSWGLFNSNRSWHTDNNTYTADTPTGELTYYGEKTERSTLRARAGIGIYVGLTFADGCTHRPLAHSLKLPNKNNRYYYNYYK